VPIVAVLIVAAEVVTAGLRRLLFKMSSTCRSALNVTSCLYKSYIDVWMNG
jgi:trehalose-6-phosphatase